MGSVSVQQCRISRFLWRILLLFLIALFKDLILHEGSSFYQNVSGKINMIGFDNRAHFCQ